MKRKGHKASAYQKMVAKKMALFYRPRNERGRYLRGKLESPMVAKTAEDQMVKRKAIELISEIMKKIA